MKDDIPRLFPVWFLPMVIFILFCSIQCGCKTGGTRLNLDSTGKVVRLNPTKKLPSPKPTQPITPPVTVTPPKSTPAKLTNTVRSTPILPEPKSAEANPVKDNPKSAGKATPFKPTVNPVPTPLPESKAKPPSLKPKLPSNIVAGDGDCIVNPLAPAKGEDEEVVVCEKAPQKNNKNWVQLFNFWTISLVGLLLLWVLYDIIKDSLRMKKQGTPIKDHLDKLKKPTKKAKVAKKTTTKKKSTKKKSK